jgi:hypothetical protein
MGDRSQKNHSSHPLRCQWDLCSSGILRSVDWLSYRRFGTTFWSHFQGKKCVKSQKNADLIHTAAEAWNDPYKVFYPLNSVNERRNSGTAGGARRNSVHGRCVAAYYRVLTGPLLFFGCIFSMFYWTTLSINTKTQLRRQMSVKN